MSIEIVIMLFYSVLCLFLPLPQKAYIELAMEGGRGGIDKQISGKRDRRRESGIEREREEIKKEGRK